MIWILTTGGTIEGLEQEQKSKNSVATISIKNLLQKVNFPFECEFYSLFSKDSRLITTEDRALLKDKIYAINSRQILITHGTITMIETAAYLGKLDIDKTIVLVGSFILGTEKDSDASFNLGYAFCALQTLEKGVYIAMNSKIFHWDNVMKNIDKNKFQEKMD
jgi:L-asparaginase